MAMQIPQRPENFGMGPAAFRLEPGGARFPSSFGLGADLNWSPQSFLDSDRCQELRYLRAFFRNQQHDHKVYDSNGASCATGAAWRRALTMGSVTPAQYIPHALRRPIAPIRLPRTIVQRFTALLFGNGRWPAIKAPGDPKTQDFSGALADAERLEFVMSGARDKGGSTGTVGLSWRFVNGVPRVTSHEAGNLDVHSWIDREQLRPEHVTQVYQTVRVEYDPETKKVGPVVYWHRRDWTPEADVVFRPARVARKGQPDAIFIVDDEETVEHKDGFPHFYWLTNTPPEEESSIDGQPDYAGVDESSLALDVVNSICVTGGIKNLDPTLLLWVGKRQAHAQSVIQKGSDNAIRFVNEKDEPPGDAKYLEIAGQAIEAGMKLTERQRKNILEGASCVIPDPDELTAAGMSSVAIEELFATMTARADVYRVQYGDGIVGILEQQVASYRKRTRSWDPETQQEADVIEVEQDEEGNEVDVVHVLDLPPRVDRDEQGNVTAVVERELGPEGAKLKLDWPPYFKPSETERQATVTTLVSANGGKPLVSHRTSVEQFAVGTMIDADEEWARIQAQKAEDLEGQAEMFPGVMVDAKPSQPLLTRSHTAGIVTVNEARGSMGLDHLPDADVPLDAYKAQKQGAQSEAAAPTKDAKTAAETQLTQAKAQQQSLLLNKGDIPAIITVNEARAMIDQAPMEGPEGLLTVAQWKAQQMALGGELGKAQAEDATDAPSPPEAAPGMPPKPPFGG